MHHAVAAWQRAAFAVADAQAHMWLSLAESIAAAPARAGAPGAAHAQSAVRRLTDAQRDLLQGWLATATGIRPAGGPRGDRDAGDAMLGALRDGARQLIVNQADWARRWNASGPGGAPDAGGFARP